MGVGERGLQEVEAQQRAAELDGEVAAGPDEVAAEGAVAEAVAVGAGVLGVGGPRAMPDEGAVTRGQQAFGDLSTDTRSSRSHGMRRNGMTF